MIRVLPVFLSLLFSSWTLAGTLLPVVEVRPHPVALTFPAEAVIEAVQLSTVAAQVAGRVLEVKADAGQEVRKGDVLMRLDPRESAEANAGAEALYVNAKANYERTHSLVQKKFMSPAALDKAKSDLDAASAGRGVTSVVQSHTQILSPIAGIVARRHTELGDMAQPGKILFTLFAPGALRATANVPQYRLREMRAVKEARVEFPETGKWIDSSTVILLPTADAGTHVSQVRVLLPADAYATAGVTPGMFARVHFVIGQAVKLTVPAVAVVRRGEVAAVYVQAKEGQLSLRQLRLGETVGTGEIEVLAGLSAGEQVVTDPIKAGILLKAGK
ncbi:MAG: efflux RND transporter periplasmic adaptor subunit [Betaproteobacteria bacterium]